MLLKCKRSSPRRLLVEADCPSLVFTKSKSGVIIVIRKYIHVITLVVFLIKKINLVVSKQRSGGRLLFQIIGEIATSWCWPSMAPLFRFYFSGAGKSPSKLAYHSGQESKRPLPAVYEPCRQSTHEETSNDACPVDSFCRCIHLVSAFCYCSESAANENMDYQLWRYDRCCESKH